MASTTLPVLGRTDSIKSTHSSQRAAVSGSDSPPLDEKKQLDLELASTDENVSEVASIEPMVAPILPWKYKWVALALIVFLPIGNTWSDSSLSSLKSTLRKELKITNTQYGVIDSASNIVNSIFPIIGGIALDWWGVNAGMLTCTVVILIGQILSAIACHVSDWRLMAGGKILAGFGDAVLDSAQRKLLFHYFGTSGLAFAGGLELSVYRAIGLIAGSTAVPIAQGTGNYAWSFWVPAIFCALSVVLCFVYIWFDRNVVPADLRLYSNKEAARRASEFVGKKKRFDLKSFWLLPWVFWAFILGMIMQSSAAGAFGSISPDFIEQRGYKAAVAGFTANARSLLPLFLLPFVGLAIDRWGHRMHLIALCPLLWVITYSLLGFSSVTPVVPVVFAAFCGLIQAFPIQATIPLLVRDQRKLGLAFGVYRAFNNAGSSIMDVVIGRLQDSTGDNSYRKVIYFVLALKSFAFFVGLWYIFVDYRYLGRGMTMSETERVEKELKVEDTKADPLTRRAVKPWVTWAGVATLSSMVVSAWTIFIIYLL